MMKKIIFLSATFFCCIQLSVFSISAQILFGTTLKGGDDGGGTINKFIPSTNTLIVVKSFESIASSPVGNLIQASDGKLYGMTTNGGSMGYGIIFSFDPASSNYKKLKDFDGTNGANPVGGLMQASDGKFYGMTSHGGNGYGIIFSFDPSSSTVTKLRDFDYGSVPKGSLMQASDGKLYGVTEQSSNGYGWGAIFSFDLSSSTYTELKAFEPSTGYYPTGSLIQAIDGKLYGMTTYGGGGGGQYGYGVIFSFDPLSSTYQKLNDFNLVNGANPVGGLRQAGDGKLYGLTNIGGGTNGEDEYGYGTIFSFNPTNCSYTKLMNFDSTSGDYPRVGLIQASDGKLYGTTSRGGSNRVGVIFSFDPASSTYSKRKDSDNIRGSGPSGSLVQANDEKLYGMAVVEDYGRGVIFSFDASSSHYAKVRILVLMKAVAMYHQALCRQVTENYME